MPGPWASGEIGAGEPLATRLRPQAESFGEPNGQFKKRGQPKEAMDRLVAPEAKSMGDPLWCSR
jgi:hypothetical protein